MNEKKIHLIDIEITASVLICLLTNCALNSLGLKFEWNSQSLEIIQKLTSVFACFLCCQDSTKASFKAGVNRIIITLVGGAVGMAAAAIGLFISNSFLYMLIVAAGILIAILLCRLTGVPYINARIGGATVAVVALTLSGTARLWYALFRLISTVYGAAVTVLVSLIFNKIRIIFKSA